MTWQRASVIRPCPALVSRELLFPGNAPPPPPLLRSRKGEIRRHPRPRRYSATLALDVRWTPGGPSRHTGAEQGVLATKAPLVVAEFLTGARDPSRFRSIP